MRLRKNGLGIFCFTLILGVTGCQKSPEKDIVVNKNEGAMEQAIQNKGDRKAGKTIPEKYSDSFENDAGDGKIVVDATIEAKEQDLPVIRVQPGEITSEDLKKWTEVLFEGEKAYEPMEQLSKQEIEQQILALKKLSNKEKLIKEYGGEQEAEEMMKFYKEEISSYEKLYQEAPEKVERKESDFAFHSVGYYEGNEQIYQDDPMEKTKVFDAEARLPNGNTGILYAVNRSEDDYKIHHMSYGYKGIPDEWNLPYKKMTEKEAQTIAETVMKKLGFKDWELWDIGALTEESNHYAMEYIPTYGGIPLYSGNVDLKSEDLYASNYEYSRLVIEVYNGAVTRVELTSPVEKIKVENNHVEVISFEEAYESFQTYMQTGYRKPSEDDPHYASATYEIRISKINRALFRVKEKNNEDNFLIIPVWVFEGETAIKMVPENPQGNLYSGEEDISSGEDVTYEEFQPCIINAIDGSVIDMGLGY